MLATTYDCVIILGGNIVRTEDGRYVPTTYEHSDQYGMLGGFMRIIAAAWMFANGQANTFLFSTGTSEKTKAVLGPDVPTEAHVYSDEFKRILNELYATDPEYRMRGTPKIFLEEYSQNTVGNIQESLSIVTRHKWNKFAIISADLHIPRVQALTELICKKRPTNVKLEFLGAETLVKQLKPGVYDEIIDIAHASNEGKKRAKNEAQGLDDIREGRYIMSEYQLHERREV